jgi:hypothetical protein
MVSDSNTGRRQVEVVPRSLFLSWLQLKFQSFFCLLSFIDIFDCGLVGGVIR